MKNAPYFENEHGQLYHGDCLEIMSAMKYDALITDPPYCSGGFTETAKQFSTRQGVEPNSRSARNWFANDNMTTFGLTWLLRSVVLNAMRSEVSHVLCFTDWRMVPHLTGPLESCGLRYSSMVVWDKMHFGLGNGFKPQHEIIMHFSGSTEYYKKNSGNVIRCPRVNGNQKKHPTEKPVGLISTLVETVAPPDGVVLDPFIGSGTLAVACERTGRKWIGIEQNERFCEIAARRVEAESKQLNLFDPGK